VAKLPQPGKPLSGLLWHRAPGSIRPLRVSENAPARLMGGATILKFSEFNEAIVSNME
jgi:hypothetical protein